MRRSTDRILVSHAGNLPRPAYLDELIDGGKMREGANQKAYAEILPKGVKEIVDRQIELGVDIVNDGEYAKAGSYGGYIHDRVTGYEMVPADPNRKPPKRAGTAERDRRDFPGFFASGLWFAGSGGPIRPGFFDAGRHVQQHAAPASSASAPARSSTSARTACKSDIDNLKAALEGKDAEGYIAALGPLSLGAGIHNEYYKSEEDYMMAVAEAVREEYKAITDAGFIVQLDEPEFCTSWYFYPDWTVEEYRKYLELLRRRASTTRIEGLPEELIRFHVCWGSGHRPHVNDIELKYIADLMVKINAHAVLHRGGERAPRARVPRLGRTSSCRTARCSCPASSRHATDLVEHPELIAERLVNYAERVGKENVQTGTDCGIGSRVGHEEVVWAKLDAMSEGARIASKKLWGK